TTALTTRDLAATADVVLRSAGWGQRLVRLRFGLGDFLFQVPNALLLARQETLVILRIIHAESLVQILVVAVLLELLQLELRRFEPLAGVFEDRAVVLRRCTRRHVVLLAARVEALGHRLEFLLRLFPLLRIGRL